MSVVISKFHFFNVERKSFSGYAMKFDHSFLGITPESFNTVDIHFTRGEEFFMIDLNMPVSTKHQGVVPSEFIGIHDTSSANGFDGHIQQCFSGNIFNHFNSDHTISLQDTKYRYLVSSSSPAFAFSSATEVTLIHFHFTAQKFFCIAGMCNNSLSNNSDSLEDRGITQSNLIGYFTGRELQFKELNDPEPIPGVLIWTWLIHRRLKS